MAFLYPDLSTALVGEWSQGELVAGRAARLTGLQEVWYFTWGLTNTFIGRLNTMIRN